jgi:hypothetical protein
VDRTRDMQPDALPGGDTADAHSGAETLLAVFQRPPGAEGETVNSAVVIAVENLASYPGLKTAADYFGPITDIAQQQGFEVANPPYEFSVGTKRLVRGDFRRGQGKLEMRQCSLVTLEHGNVLSFTIIAGSDDEVDRLIENLRFQATPMQKKTR